MQYSRRRLDLVVIIASLAAGSACSQPAREPVTAAKDFSSGQTRVPGEYLVTLAEAADAKVIAEIYGRFGIKGTRGLGNNLFLVTLTEDPGPAKLEELRSHSAQVKAVQPNFVYRAQGRGNVK